MTEDLISNSCWKGQLPKQDIIKEDFFQLVYWKENLGDQINKDNCENIFQDVFLVKRPLMMIKAISRLFNSQVHWKFNGSY